MSLSERPSEVHSLHFELPDLPVTRELTFHLAMRAYPLVVHTDTSREEARESNRFLRALPHDAITHHVTVHAPTDAVALGYTTGKVLVDGIETSQVLTMSIVLPRATRLRDVHRGLLLGEGLHPKLAYRRSNLLLSELNDLESMPDQIAALQDPYETAVAILFQHPELINLNATATEGGPMTVIEACVRKALSEYSLLTEMIRAHPNDWSKVVRVMDEQGKPAFDDEGKPLFTTEFHPDVQSVIANPLSRALVYAKQNEGLRGQLWSLQYGITKASYDGEVKPKPKLLEDEPPRGANDVRWKVKNLTPNAGLVLEDAVPYTPATAATNWRAEGYWSSQDDKAAEPFTPEMRKALDDGKLWMSFDGMLGLLTPDATEKGKYTVEMKSADQVQSASGSCHLNTDGTELQYNVTSKSGPFAVASFAIGERSGPHRRVHLISVRNGGSNGTMTVKAKNHWLRHLSAYVEFLDPNGKPKQPANWDSRLPVIERIYDNDPTRRFLDIVNPVEAMMGIPLPADTTHLTFPVPADASMVRISWGGLGSGRRDPVACGIGEILTVSLEMALPVVLLAAGAALTKAGGLMKIIKEKPVVGAILVSLAGAYIGVSDDPGKAALTIGKKLLPAIGKAGIGKLSEAIAEMIAVGAAKRAVPFLNIAFLVADVAATAASLGQTSVAIRDSPRVYTTEITRSIDLKVTITTSPLYKKFPDHHHHISVVVVYDSGATLPALTKELPDTTLSENIVLQFREVPAAGNLRVMVFFYAANGWQSGQGASGWLKAEGNTGGSPLLNVPDIEIDINEVPLTRSSVYEYMERIVYENGKHVWKGAKDLPAPTSTKFTKPDTGGVIEKLLGITVAQYAQMVGYAWQATDLKVPPDDPTKQSSSLSTVQNLSLLADPQKKYAAPSVGFIQPSAIAYDLVSPDNGTGRNFFIDSSRGVYDEGGDPAGGFHLRRVRIEFKGDAVPDYRIRTNESWGRFRHAVDAMVVHPHGYVFAIRRGTHKIYRLQLPDKATSDAEAPFAMLLSGEGKRDGLIKSPIAITLALDGRVLVLEGGNDRVQCFDINGNPVEYFKDPATGRATPVLSVVRQPKLTLLDMAVEAKGHIFILGHSGDGRKAADYRVDLYDPSGTFLTSTPNFTAARITVDVLRNLFALNYEVLRGLNGRTEPSISHWRPPAPSK